MRGVKRATMGSCKSTRDITVDTWLSPSISGAAAQFLGTALREAVVDTFKLYPDTTLVEFVCEARATPAKSSRSRRGSAKK